MTLWAATFTSDFSCYFFVLLYFTYRSYLQISCSSMIQHAFQPFLTSLNCVQANGGFFCFFFWQLKIICVLLSHTCMWVLPESSWRSSTSASADLGRNGVKTSLRLTQSSRSCFIHVFNWKILNIQCWVYKSQSKATLTPLKGGSCCVFYFLCSINVYTDEMHARHTHYSLTQWHL